MYTNDRPQALVLPHDPTTPRPHTTTTNMSTSTSTIAAAAAAPEPQQPESPHVAPGSEAVHDAIRDLLADEYPATQHGGQVHREQYLEINHKTFIRYLKFVYKTWAGVASSFVRLLSFQISRRHLFLPITPLPSERALIKVYTASGSS